MELEDVLKDRERVVKLYSEAEAKCRDLEQQLKKCQEDHRTLGDEEVARYAEFRAMYHGAAKSALDFIENIRVPQNLNDAAMQIFQGQAIIQQLRGVLGKKEKP